MYVCLCRGLTEADVRCAGRAGALTPASLVPVLGLDDAGCCGRCAEDIDTFVALAWEGVGVHRPDVASDGGTEPSHALVAAPGVG